VTAFEKESLAGKEELARLTAAASEEFERLRAARYAVRSRMVYG
jgi:hypothetical protein